MVALGDGPACALQGEIVASLPYLCSTPDVGPYMDRLARYDRAQFIIVTGYDSEAKEIYKQRAATAECANALARNRGLLRLPVRGLSKVRSVVGLFVLAHNLMRMATLAPQLIGWSGSPSAVVASAT